MKEKLDKLAESNRKEKNFASGLSISALVQFGHSVERNSMLGASVVRKDIRHSGQQLAGQGMFGLQR